MRCIAFFFVVGGLCVLQSGCLLMEPVQEMGRQTRRMFTFRPGDYRDMTDEETEDWTNNVGREARANQRFEQDPDPWWSKWIMSEKARRVERSLGYKHE